MVGTIRKKGDNFLEKVRASNLTQAEKNNFINFATYMTISEKEELAETFC